MRRICSFFMITLLTIGLAACGDPTQTTVPGVSPTPKLTTHSGNFDQSLEVGGLTRTYTLHLPPAISQGQPLPVVLAFHGSGGQGKSMVGLTGFNAMADQKEFIAVYPDGIDRTWNDGREAMQVAAQRKGIDDIAFVTALLDRLSQDYKIDRKRVYATGMSNGAFFTERLACQMADKIAAFAPVAGLLPPNLGDCNPAQPVSILIINGTADPLVPYQGGKVAANRGIGYSVADTTQHWANQAKCPSNPTVTDLPDTNTKDGTTVKRESYSGCAAGSEVILYTIENGGHTWPGGVQYLPENTIGKTNRDISASAVIWDFFSRHTL